MNSQKIKKIGISQEIELAGARGSLYQLLAAVYASPPDIAFLELLKGWTDSLVSADGISYGLPEQLRGNILSLSRFFNESSSLTKLAEMLAIDYTMLIRGVKQEYSPPPPYESVYQEDDGRVFGLITTEIKEKYLCFGLDTANELHGEPPDHLSFELEFMRILCAREAEAWGKGDEASAVNLVREQRGFLEEHLLTWLPRFCQKVREFDRNGFYDGFAELTEGWVRFDDENCGQRLCLSQDNS